MGCEAHGVPSHVREKSEKDEEEWEQTRALGGVFFSKIRRRDTGSFGEEGSAPQFDRNGATLGERMKRDKGTADFGLRRERVTDGEGGGKGS